ncbi:MAG: DUF6787 family protein, partial [Flammeovirgaceae bacterium]
FKSKMTWLQKLQTRWKVGSLFQVLIILVVFACTGFTVLFLKRPLFNYWFSENAIPTYASVLYYVLILPIYNVLLLLYGFIFGQFSFFWEFEKRFFSRIISIFRPNKKA